MKLAEIMKHNEEMLAKNFAIDKVFFTQLYNHCIKSLEMIPPFYISDMYFVDSLYFETNKDGNTVVSFNFHDCYNEDYFHDYVVKGINLYSHGFNIMIPLNKKNHDDVVIFWLEDNSNVDFDLSKANEVFSDYLVSYEKDDFGSIRIDVLTKWFI